MVFTDIIPGTWVELQDRVCTLLNQAGYKASSPCLIETVRGSVEVDVLVESPDELIKKIICECKFWNSAVPKEKVHAFRTVVGDAGASLGLLISKSGFQTGAIEAARLSNVNLLTWDEFTQIIENKWILNQLKLLKKESAPISIYTDPLDFPFEKLTGAYKSEYLKLCDKYVKLRHTCWMITKTDLLSSTETSDWYKIKQFSCIEAYINQLRREANEGVNEFKQLLDCAGATIPKSKFDSPDGYLYAFLN